MSEREKPTEADCAYLAALIDGRARVRVWGEKRGGSVYRKIELTLGPITLPQAEWLGSKFGGGRRVLGIEGKENPSVTFVTTDAAMLCVHAYPYLLVMKRQAQLVNRFAQSLGGKGVRLTTDQAAIRSEVARELQMLERSGGGKA